jgi:hypothetical protein
MQLGGTNVERGERGQATEYAASLENGDCPIV